MESAERSNWPCGHKRGTFDPVDADFDVICPVCFGHFFRYAYLPFAAFVGLFTTVYFWRPIPLSGLLFIVFDLFALSYVCAILRKRPWRLLLVVAIASPIAALMLTSSSGSSPIAFGDPVSWCSLLILATVLLLSFIHGLLRVPALRDVHNASGPVVALIVLSVFITLVNITVEFSHTFVPLLSTVAYFQLVRDIVAHIQRYRLALVLLAIAVALVWSAAHSISAAREREATGRVDHRVLAEIRRLLAFFANVLVNTVVELWLVFRDSMRRIWLIAGSTVRVLILAAVAFLLFRVISVFASNTAALWETAALWPSRAIIEGLTLTIPLIWIGSWCLILVALIRDPRNGRRAGWLDDVIHAHSVLRYNLVRSAPIYWFYLSLALFATWFLIYSLRFAFGTARTPQAGGVFLTYMFGALLATAIWLPRRHRESAAIPQGSGLIQKERDAVTDEEAAVRTLYRVTCDACGAPAEVPFDPINGKPVYCGPCFQDRRPRR